LLRDALKSSHEPMFLPNASHLLPEDAPEELYAQLTRQEKAESEAAGDALFKILT